MFGEGDRVEPGPVRQHGLLQHVPVKPVAAIAFVRVVG